MSASLALVCRLKILAKSYPSVISLSLAPASIASAIGMWGGGGEEEEEEEGGGGGAICNIWGRGSETGPSAYSRKEHQS